MKENFLNFLNFLKMFLDKVCATILPRKEKAKKIVEKKSGKIVKRLLVKQYFNVFSESLFR